MGVGSRGIRQPNAVPILEGHNDRIGNLERTINSQTPGQRPRVTPHDVPFSYSGPLSPSLSPRWYPRFSERLTAVFFSLETAGSTATTLKVYQSGVALTPTGTGSATITIPAATHTLKSYFDIVFSADADYFQVEIVTVGTGAEDLDAQARFG
jgi:hypothetical protein